MAILTPLYTFFCGFMFSKKTYQENKSHRIYETGIFTHILADFYGKLVYSRSSHGKSVMGMASRQWW